MLKSYFIKLKKAAIRGFWKKQSSQVFYKNAVLKNFVMFMGKHLCEIIKNIYFEEHLRMAASELTLWSDHLELFLDCI